MAGFTNINLDLMYSIPRQNSASWQQSLEKALSLAPTHLSLYELTVEHGTPFHEQLRCGQLDLPHEEEMAAMDQITAQLCHNNGFEQYEISNYARPGYQCRHNINYWQNGPYLAIGAGAVACVEGRRQRRINDPLRYCASIESNQSVIAEEECLDATASCKETVIMGLRMLQGVALEPLRQRYNMDVKTCYGTILTKLVEQGLLELTASHLRLTSTGLRFANQVMAELV
jgi:oxygen-independent coproporphyrinogen-3 oxidase